MKEEEIILIDSPKAAFKIITIGWINRHGQFCGRNKEAAFCSGATYRYCEDCNSPAKIGYTACEPCRVKFKQKKYFEKPQKEWDGIVPLYSDAVNEYFYDHDGIEDYCEEYNCKIDDLWLLICEPEYLREYDISEHNEDNWPEDFDSNDIITGELEAAIDNLNDIIKKQKPISWFPGKFRPIFKQKQEEIL